jgi:hypothetical protein
MKKFIMFLFLVVITTTVVVLFKLTSYVSPTKKETNPDVVLPIVLEELSKIQIESSLELIEDASSELNGKWLGLCPRESIKSVEDFKTQVDNDPVLAEHFLNFSWDKSRIKVLSESNKFKVSHRSGSIIKPSKKEINLPAGDKLITDGKRTVRMHCCNDVIEATPTPVPPVETPKVHSPKAYVEVYPPVSFPHNDPTTLSPATLSPATFTEYSHRSGGFSHSSVTPTPVNPVPEPATLLLFGAGISALAFVKKKFK